MDESNSQINKKYTVSTDKSLQLGMLADNKKLKQNVTKKKPDLINNIVDSSTSDDLNNFHISKNNNIDTPDSDSFQDSDLKIHSVKANSDDFKAQKMMYDHEKSMNNDKNMYDNDKSMSQHNNTPSEFKSNIDIQNADEIPFHMLDEKTKKLKRMEKYAQLIRIQNSGIKLTKTYNLNSDYEEMCFEVKYWTDYKNKKDAVNLGKSFMLNAIQGIEFLNERYDPFGIKLKGWHDQVQVCSDSYDDVFGELYEKYKGSGRKIEPEIKLLLMVSASAASFHASKKMTEKIPGLDSVLENNPELLAKIQKTINSGISNNGKPTVKSQREKEREMYEQMQKIKEQRKKYDELQKKQEEILKNNEKINEQMSSIKKNQNNKQNMNDILNRIKKENINRKAENFLNDTESSSSLEMNTNIGEDQDNDSVTNSATLTLDSGGKPVKRRRRKKKSTISIIT